MEGKSRTQKKRNQSETHAPPGCSTRTFFSASPLQAEEPGITPQQFLRSPGWSQQRSTGRLDGWMESEATVATFVHTIREDFPIWIRPIRWHQRLLLWFSSGGQQAGIPSASAEETCRLPDAFWTQQSCCLSAELFTFDASGSIPATGTQATAAPWEFRIPPVRVEKQAGCLNAPHSEPVVLWNNRASLQCWLHRIE